MKPYQQHRRALIRAARQIVREHRTVRESAKAFGMSRGGFWDFCQLHGIKFRSRAEAARVREASR